MHVFEAMHAAILIGPNLDGDIAKKPAQEMRVTNAKERGESIHVDLHVVP